MLSDICLEDVVDSKPKKSWSPMDYLTEVTRVASDKYDREKAVQSLRFSLLHLRAQQKPMKKRSSISLKKRPINPFLDIPKNERLAGDDQKLIIKKRPMNPFLDIPKNERLAGDDQKLIIKKRPINPFLDIPKNERLAGDDQKLMMKNKRKNNNGTEKNNKKKKDLKTLHGLNPPPDMPLRMRNRIGEIGGSNIMLVIQKALFPTDLSEGHNRLSIPVSDVKNEFLTDDEKASLKMKQGGKWVGIEALLIDPELDEFRIKLKRWEMEKNKKKKKDTNSSSSVKSNPMYVLVKPWKEVVKANNFVKEDVVQVWSFRSPKSQLCFALVKVTTQAEDDGASTSAN